MEDRDWYDPPVSTSYDDPSLTNFSSHDAYIQRALLLDFSGGISIPIAQAVALKALVAFSYMSFSWIGRDGYREYRREGGEKIAMPGKHITYDQHWKILSLGLGLFWPFHRALGLDFRFFCSPLIFADDADTHLNTKTQFNDDMLWGLYLEPVLDFSFAPNRYFSLVLHGSWRYITGTRGDISETTVGASSSIPPKISKGQAGAAYSAFDVGLSLKFALPLGLLSKKN
jgi:outer membrane protease